MTEGFVDPGDVPEQPPMMNAKTLKNKVLLLKPTGTGEWPPKDDKKAQPYVVCDVWVLDRSGVTETGQGVRFSWWRAVAQLSAHMGEFVGCKPVERDDNSVELMALEGDARTVAAQVVADIVSTEPM